MLLYILLTIIAVGVLLLSHSGRAFLMVIFWVVVTCLGLSIIVFIGISLFNSFIENKNELMPIFNWLESAVSIIFAFVVLGSLICYVVFKALYPLGYEKNRQIWTGEIRDNKPKENEIE